MKVALCCIGRLENQYAVEFVEHYRKLGFDKIFIYDNNHDGEEHFEHVLGDFINDGIVEIIDVRNKQAVQMESYSDCYKKHCYEYDWIAFFDMDEFLIINGDIHDFMTRYDSYQCLLLNWMIMTDNGQIYNTRRPLMERFTTPMDFNKVGEYGFSDNNHVKSIVRGYLGEINFSNPHVPSTKLECCNANGEKCEQLPWQSFDHSIAYLKHFQYKTVEEWLVKMGRGTADRTYDEYEKVTSVDNFFRVNEKTDEKLEYLKIQRRQFVIVSMTTIPKRKKRLMDNLPALINQSFRYDKLIINVDDNLSDEDYKWYEELKNLDDRIEINKSEAKWRSCNKLLPTIKKYPHELIVTLDDDVFYPRDTILMLMEEHYKHPECVIAHEVNPISLLNDGKFVTYINGYDVKLMQVEWGKYLSNCALFPPYTFDGTDLYDYDKMMECTNGTHDELWFWVQSTLNGVQCVGLNYVRSFAPEMLEQYKEDEYCLSSFNNTEEKIGEYMEKINKIYGERLIQKINSKETIFVVTKDNIYSFFFLLPYIRSIYNYGAKIIVNNLTKDWLNKLLNIINNKEIPRI